MTMRLSRGDGESRMRVTGIDPAIAKGKPIAIVTLELTSETPRITGVVAEAALGGPLWEKFEIWRMCLRCVIEQQRPDLVAIENARGPGGKGSAHLRALVTLLKDRAESLGVPVILVNNQQAKSAVLSTFERTAERVALAVRYLVENAAALPTSDGYDYEAAVSIALAGEGLWREKQMREG